MAQSLTAKDIVYIKDTDVWTYSPIASTWYQRESLKVARSDAAAVVFETPTRSFVIVIGNGRAVEYFDLNSASATPVQVAISGDGPSEYEGSLSMFVHDSHLFLVGGLAKSGSSDANTLLNIVKVNQTGDGGVLTFSYVPIDTGPAIPFS
ncbi:hypothetical protein GGF31_006883 [Allomyces arbusculus]|nr:hypothetical protein GGF31_006883 [Allomyces arbusculus]